MHTVDAYTHFAPPELTAYLEEKSGGPMVFKALFDAIPELTDIDARLRYMDDHNINVHCLVPLPWLETTPKVFGNPGYALEACDICNKAMSKLVARHPDRFVGVALLPTCCGGEAMAAMAWKAVHVLGLKGVALFTGPTSTPPDDPCFEPLYSTCEALGAPIWVHPSRPQSYPDYEKLRGSGSAHQIWNSLSWIYDTSVYMVHMALGGVFRRYPNLKVITHHHGGMIPFFTERFETQRRNFEDRQNPDVAEQTDLLEDLRMFYCDTATFGVNSGNIRAALDFFLPGRVLFGTDTPMDCGRRGLFTRTALQSVKSVTELTEEEEEAIMGGNACALLGLKALNSRL